jgi:hypothetical protein
MFEPTWADTELLEEHNIATLMKEKLKFFTDSFYNQSEQMIGKAPIHM